MRRTLRCFILSKASHSGGRSGGGVALDEAADGARARREEEPAHDRQRAGAPFAAGGAWRVDARRRVGRGVADHGTPRARRDAAERGRRRLIRAHHRRRRPEGRAGRRGRGHARLCACAVSVAET